MGQIVRERPPLRLHWHIKTPGGSRYRWAGDEHKPENTPSAATFSTTLPGGFESHAVTLPRKPGVDYPDLVEFSTITAAGVNGRVAWQGRLETAPRASGDQIAITPGAVGWQAALQDNQNVRMIYVDRDMTGWEGPTIQRQLNLIAISGAPLSTQVGADPNSSRPAIVAQATGDWVATAVPWVEAWYDAQNIPLGSIHYGWTKGANISAADANWTWQAYLLTDDVASAVDASGNLRSAGPGSGTVTATVGDRTWALLLLNYAAAATGSANIPFTIYWTQATVYGAHGLTIRGTDPDTGLYASDIIQHAVQAWAPQLAVTKAGASTIEQSSVVITQMAFKDPTTVANIIAQATMFGLPDWWVDEGSTAAPTPTFNLASRDNHGNTYVARVGPSGLTETGPQVDRMWNSVIVQYNDASGITRTVGPPGSRADTTDASLVDSDPTNPCNVAGIIKRALLKMGIISTPTNAILYGGAFLQEQRLTSTAGQATISGYAQSASSGAWVPAWALRAGDRISFIDAHDPSPRRIIATEYSDQTKQNVLTLDSPPDGLDALLQRLSASLQPLGLS